MPSERKFSPENWFGRQAFEICQTFSVVTITADDRARCAVPADAVAAEVVFRHAEAEALYEPARIRFCRWLLRAPQTPAKRWVRDERSVQVIFRTAAELGVP